MTSVMACLDIRMDWERPAVAERSSRSRGNDSFPWPALQLGEIPPPSLLRGYIAVEHRKFREACATIWPVIDTEEASGPTGRRHTRSILGGAFSIAVHLGIAVMAYGMVPTDMELPTGSENLLPIEIIDEAAFAALEEGGAQAALPDFALALPDDIMDFDIRNDLAEHAEVALVEPEEKKQPVEEKPPVKVEKPVTKQPEIRRKPVKRQETQVARNGPSSRGTGTNNVSSASARKGRAGATEGMAGKAITANYRSKVIAHLGRYKSYPASANALRLEGSVRVTFSIGSDGLVKSASVSTSSGHNILDRDALSMLRRAQPFPKSEGSSPDITITTQIGYNYPR